MQHLFLTSLLIVNALGQYPQTFLEWLVYPMSATDFISSYLYKKPLHIKRSNPTYYDVFKLQDVYPNLLSSVDTVSKHKDFNNLRGFPQIRALKYGNELENELESFRMDQKQAYLQYLNQSEIDKLNQYHLSLNHNLGDWDYKALKYAEINNFTIRFYQAETHSKITQNLAQSYMDYLPAFYARTNIYRTPMYNKGFAIHHDIEDIFILQIKGNKRWKVYKHSFKYCNLYDYNWDEHVEHPETLKTFNLCMDNVISPWELYDYKYQIGQYIKNNSELVSETMEFVAETGDLIYLPRGYMHEASMQELGDYNGESIHLSLGVYLELYVDYLYNFCKYLFVKCKKCNGLLLEKYLNVKGNDRNDKVKYVLENFDIFLRSVAFTNDELRLALPYFYVCQLDVNMNENDFTVFKMFGQYFESFMQFLYAQNAMFDRIEFRDDDIHGFIEILGHKFRDKNYKLFLKIKKRICMKYMNDYKKSNGIYVYADKKMEKRFKRISLPMRYDEIRIQLSQSQRFQ